MQRVLQAIGLTLGLFLPLGVAAMQTDTYDLRPGLVNARWEGKGTITMQQEANGILLTTGDSTGTLLTSGVPEKLAEAASITLAAARDTHVSFIWKRIGGDSSYVSFDVPAGNTLPISFSLRQNPAWKGGIESIGLVLPPQSAVLLNRIDFLRWSIFEKMSEAVRSFFIFDSYRPYSINFVWGPVLALNPIEQHAVYRNLPPQQIYATYALNIALVSILVLLILWARLRRVRNARRFVLRSFVCVMLGTWILMDLRMGAEFLSWVSSDRSAYIRGHSETREFRDRGRFYDFAAFAKPYLFDRGSYAFFAQQAWPYLGNMRYLTYPSIPGISIETDDTWVIYDRPDMDVSDAGQITIDGVAVSEPGRILGRFDASSFVFRTFDPPLQP